MPKITVWLWWVACVALVGCADDGPDGTDRDADTQVADTDDGGADSATDAATDQGTDSDDDPALDTGDDATDDTVTDSADDTAVDSASDSGADSSSDCLTVIGLTRLTPASGLMSAGRGFVAFANPGIGEAMDDLLWFELGLDPAPGTLTLELPSSAAECHLGNATVPDAPCATVAMDIADDGVLHGATFAGYGTIELNSVALPFYVDATLDLELVEVTQAGDDVGTYTVVPDGQCIILSEVQYTIDPPVAGWTCAFNSYDDGVYCDCRCGALDPDCTAGRSLRSGCEIGQTCSADGTACEGTPTYWTCDPSEYGGGSGNGCDCECGVPDPDCELAGEALQGCLEGEVCVVADCTVPGWTCASWTYAQGRVEGATAFCNCGCGAVDPDCDDATVASCDSCFQPGSCGTGDCPDNIDPGNNAVCR